MNVTPKTQVAFSLRPFTARTRGRYTPSLSAVNGCSENATLDEGLSVLTTLAL